MADRTYAIWALGEAGYFEMQPAAHYKATYDDMVQAVEILYFVTDVYNEPRKKGGGPTANLIYQEVGGRTPLSGSRLMLHSMLRIQGSHVLTQQRRNVYSTGIASFSSCLSSKGSTTLGGVIPLYTKPSNGSFLCVGLDERVGIVADGSQNDFERCKARHEGRVIHVKPDRPSRTTETSPASSAATAASGRAPSGSKVATKKTDAPPKKDDNWWEAATLFEFMQKAVNQRVIRAGRNSITIERVAQLLIKRFEIDHVATARNVLLVHAQNLCYMMDHPRRQNIRFFAAEPVYGELAAGHNLSAAEQRRAEGVELRPRKNHSTLRGDSSESSDTSDDEDEDVITTPRRRLPGRSKKGTLSVLRPKSAQFSGKGSTSAPRGSASATSHRACARRFSTTRSPPSMPMWSAASSTSPRASTPPGPAYPHTCGTGRRAGTRTTPPSSASCW